MMLISMLLDIRGHSMWQAIWLLQRYCFLRAKSAGLLCPWDILGWSMSQISPFWDGSSTDHQISAAQMSWYIMILTENVHIDWPWTSADSAERQQVWFLHYPSHSHMSTGYAMRAPVWMISVILLQTDRLTNCKPGLQFLQDRGMVSTVSDWFSAQSDHISKVPPNENGRSDLSQQRQAGSLPGC